MDNRYYFENLENSQVKLTGGEAQHLTKVRRAQVGDEIVAFNGDGFDYLLSIDEIKKDLVLASLIEKKENRAQNDVNIVVYLAMLKNEALTTTIDHLAELNVKEVKLFKSDFSVANIEEKKLDKLKSISIQASKQCERATIMNISIINKKDIEKDILKFENRYFAYEDSTGKIENFKGDFAVIIGPEGGFSPDEVNYFSSFANNVSLGKTILRAEVASVVAVATLKAVQNEG